MNIDKMMRNAGIPSSEEVLLNQVEDLKKENYLLKLEVKKADKEIFVLKKRFHKLRRETGRFNKKSYRKDMMNQE